VISGLRTAPTIGVALCGALVRSGNGANPQAPRQIRAALAGLLHRLEVGGDDRLLESNMQGGELDQQERVRRDEMIFAHRGHDLIPDQPLGCG
jgi:hypothetical protein